MTADQWFGDTLAIFAGLLVSPGRGLLVYQPWVLLAFAALLPSVRKRISVIGRTSGPPGWVWFCVVVIVLHIALVSHWRSWWGGFSWGSRLVCDIVPLLALLCLRPIAVLWQTARGRWLVTALALLGLLVQLPAVYFDAIIQWNRSPDIDKHPERLWSWPEAPFLYWGRGRVGGIPP
jgi:hypothetical protein